MEKEQRKGRRTALIATALFVLCGLLGAQNGVEDYRTLKEQIEAKAAKTSEKGVRALKEIVPQLASIDLSGHPKVIRDRERFLLSLARKFTNEKSYHFRKTALLTLGDVLATPQGVSDLLSYIKAATGKRDMRAEWGATALARMTSPAAHEHLLRIGLTKKDTRTRFVFLRALAELKDQKLKERSDHYREAIMALTFAEKPKLAGAALRAVGNLELDVVDALVAQRRHEDSLIRLASAWALGKLHKKPHARDGLAELLVDKHARVREQAAISLGQTGDVEACGDLIPRLRKEGRRNRFAITQALTKLTGLRHGDTIGAWESWWAVAKVRLQEGKSLGLPTEKEPERIDGGQGRYDARYYGVPIHSDRILFVIDISQSMRFGGIQDDPCRIEMAKTELKKVIDQLKPDMRFNILVFSTGNALMSQKGLIHADARNRRRAKKWVDRLVAAGGTNTFGALKAAFKKQKEIDTVYMLSDGEPSRGGITDPEAILAWVREQNLRRRLLIHTVALVKWNPTLSSLDHTGQANAASQFMKELADVCRGKFSRLD